MVLHVIKIERRNIWPLKLISRRSLFFLFSSSSQASITLHSLNLAESVTKRWRCSLLRRGSSFILLYYIISWPIKEKKNTAIILLKYVSLHDPDRQHSIGDKRRLGKTWAHCWMRWGTSLHRTWKRLKYWIPALPQCTHISIIRISASIKGKTSTKKLLSDQVKSLRFYSSPPRATFFPYRNIWDTQI